MDFIEAFSNVNLSSVKALSDERLQYYAGQKHFTAAFVSIQLNSISKETNDRILCLSNREECRIIARRIEHAVTADTCS